VRKKYLYALLVLFSWLETHGQTNRLPITAAYTGAGAYSISHYDVFSFSSNTAALAPLRNSSVAVYGERRFMLQDLNHFTAAMGLCTRSGNFGLFTRYYGFSEFNETEISLAYARKLDKKIDVGVRFNYHGISISSGYGNTTAISAEAGLIMHLTEKFHAGVQVSNPIGGKFGKNSEEKLPASYRFGCGFEASEKFLLMIELEKEEDMPVNMNTGFQYRILKQLLVRCGVSTATSNLYAGVGFSLRSYRVDITSSYHPQLGVTPGLLLLLDLKK
jgi:hypothetical protein